MSRAFCNYTNLNAGPPKGIHFCYPSIYGHALHHRCTCGARWVWRDGGDGVEPDWYEVTPEGLSR